MPVFEIESGGKIYEVDAPDENTAASAFSQMNRGVLSDVGSEIRKSFNSNLETIQNAGGHGEKTVGQGWLDTGKAALAVPGLLASPITGAVRALGGAGMKAVTDTATTGLQSAFGGTRQEMPLETAKDQAETASMAVRPAGMGARGPLPLPAQAPTAAELKRAAGDVWQSPQTKAIQAPTQDVAALAAKIENDLLQAGHRASVGSAPGAFAEVKRMTPAQGVASIGVDDLRAARKAFGETAKQVGPDFRPTPDAAAASRAIGHIDDYLDTLSPALRDANANYRAGRSAESLDYRTIKADRGAAITGSGSNIENKLRQAMDKIPDRGLSPDEIAARNRIALGSPARNALRKIGKLGVSDGLSLMLGVGAAGATGGSSITITAAGTAARKIGEILTRREIAALNKSIRSRSPLAKQLAANPQFAKAPKGIQAVVAALLGQGGQGAAVPRMLLPAYGEENQ